jgi:hypothetical protein
LLNLAPPPQCRKPAMVRASNIGYAQATLNWNAQNGAEPFRIVYMPLGKDSARKTMITAPGARVWLLDSLQPGTQYLAKVSRICPSGESEPTETRFTTLSCPAPTRLSVANLDFTAAQSRFYAILGGLEAAGLLPEAASPEEKAFIRELSLSGGALASAACAFLRSYDKAACPASPPVLPTGLPAPSGLAELGEAVYTLYPSPTGGELTLKLSQPQSGLHYQIFNSAGQIVLSAALEAEGAASYALEASQLPPGLYILVLRKTAQPQPLFTTKFIKQ